MTTQIAAGDHVPAVHTVGYLKDDLEAYVPKHLMHNQLKTAQWEKRRCRHRWGRCDARQASLRSMPSWLASQTSCCCTAFICSSAGRRAHALVDGALHVHTVAVVRRVDVCGRSHAACSPHHAPGTRPCMGGARTTAVQSRKDELVMLAINSEWVAVYDQLRVVKVRGPS